MKAYEWFGVVLVSLSALGCGAVCGDGELSKDEACDDGNVANADGCEANCALPACGNGIVDPGELCLTEKRFPAPTIAGGTTFISGGDLNQDQLPDIAVALRGDNAVSVLFNQGENLFGAEQFFSLPAGNGLQDLIIADLVVNGFPDLVTANQISTNVSILQNQANQPFTQELTLDFAGQIPRTLLARDLDGDNGDDLVVLNFGADDLVTVLLNNGAGIFVESPSSPLALIGNASPLEVLVEDVDRNGAQDVAVLGTDDAIHVFLGQGDGSFSASSAIPVPGGDVAQLGVGDINGDNLPDLLATTGLEGNLLTFINQGGGNLVLAQTFAFSLQTGDDFFVVDLDNDGKLDVVSPRVQQGFDVCIGDGNGLFASPLNFSVTNLVNEIVISDFNNDSVLDVVLTDGLTGEVVVFFSEP
jgi:cysteine-rich repeat protein